MRYYFAPLEGITGYIFRRTYDAYFGGIDAYYTPFLTTRDGGIMKNKEKKDIQLDNNIGINVVPQLMTKNSSEFIQASEHIRELGYCEVNLNLGCPSGTVVPKHKGSGLIRFPDELHTFLEGIFNGCHIDISIKSRIGFSSEDEFFQLLDIYNEYPVKKLIIHLRTREEFYSGEVHKEMYDYAYHHTDIPLIYNGDVVSADDVRYIEGNYPDTYGVMIGRGYLTHPGFVGNGSLLSDYTDTDRVFEFADGLKKQYTEVLYGETPVLHKMKELWGYLSKSLPDGDDFYRRIKKVKNMRDYDRCIS